MQLRTRTPWLLLGLFFGLVVALASYALPIGAWDSKSDTPGRIWRDVDEPPAAFGNERRIVPSQFRMLRADGDRLASSLAHAPADSAKEDDGLLLYLPLPDGRSERFRVYSTSVMAPELAAKFPNFRTYRVIGVDDVYASGRLDYTPRGFHAMVTSANRTFYIDPYRNGDAENYISFFDADYAKSSSFVEHGPIGDSSEVDALVEELRANGSLSSGAELRVYRLAVATTGEYALFHGGRIDLAMAEIVTAVNRVTGILEREVAVQLELVADNDQIIFLDPETDPYSNSNPIAMLGQNITTLNNVIGSANYDIGHVFSTGSGGIAYLGAVCGTLKAGGVTGLSSPVGDPFFVDYVSHEIGHQFGATHTFNGTSGSCSASNRHAPTAYEPGSGTTIMAYAGICGNQDIQANSDDYFHGASFDQIVAFTTAGLGNDCSTVISTGNNSPIVDAGGLEYTIPLRTPFTLTGSGSDPDGDSVTFNWEEFDLGEAGHPNHPLPADGTPPLFRSFPASTLPSRTFPQIADIANGVQTMGEILPTYARSLNFRLTARDNHLSPSAGGVSYDTLSLNVVDQAGPFLVTKPNAPLIWREGDQVSVEWSVANSDMPPVSCNNVNIRLSTDGGYTYPDILAANTPNDGEQSVISPINPSTFARVMVECSNNIFFDVSDAARAKVFLPAATNRSE